MAITTAVNYEQVHQLTQYQHRINQERERMRQQQQIIAQYPTYQTSVEEPTAWYINATELDTSLRNSREEYEDLREHYQSIYREMLAPRIEHTPPQRIKIPRLRKEYEDYNKETFTAMTTRPIIKDILPGAQKLTKKEANSRIDLYLEDILKNIN